MEKEKFCPSCEIVKSTDDFWNKPSSTDGKSSICSKCDCDKKIEQKRKRKKKIVQFVIYTLSHPLTKEVRYVGSTDEIKRRYYEHISDAQNGGKTYKDNWVKSLLKQNLKPIIEIIEICETREILNEAEIFYIAYLRYLGVRLTNTAPGGNKLSIVFHSNETRDILVKAAKTKRKLSPEKARERKLKLSEKAKGQIRPLEACEKIREAKLGDKNPNFGSPISKRKLTFDQAQEIRKKYMTGSYIYTDLSDEYDLNISSIISIIKNETYLTPNVNNHRRALTLEEAKEIKKMYEDGGYTYNQLAEKYKVNGWWVIRDIVKSKSYLV